MIARTRVLDAAFDFMPDDTEETLVGASPHQDSIYVLYDGLLACGPDRGLPWFVGNQLTMIIRRHQGRPAYQPSPDILVHPTLTQADRSSLDVDRDGPPALIVEVASPATARDRDLNPSAKPGIYASIDVQEYIVFDPTEEFIPGHVWARRLGSSGYDLWLPNTQGRWESNALGISFQMIGTRLRIYDQQGNLVPTRRERTAAHDHLTTENSLLSQALADERRRRAELESELRRLRGQ